MRIILLILLGLSLISAGGTEALAKGPKDCPPGLAKKNPPCVPPGLAKKGYGPGDRIDDGDYDVLRPGDRVVFDGLRYDVVMRDGELVLERDGRYYPLPDRSSDSEYVQIGDAFIKVDRKTKAVIEVFQLADLILG